MTRRPAAVIARSVLGAFAVLLALYAAGAVLVLGRAAGMQAPALDGKTPAAGIVFYTPDTRQMAARLDAAARLWHGHRPAVIAVVGGARPKRDYFGSPLAADMLVGRGVPRDRVMSERRSDDSLSNVAAARELVGDGRGGVIVLVSDRFHLLRLRSLAGRAFPGAQLEVWPSERDWTARAVLHDVHWEIAGWLLQVLPEGWRRTLVGATRS